MHKKLTITIDENIYNGLYAVIGPGHISQFIENLVAPYVLDQELEKAYQEMAQDREREQLAEEWTEGTLEDFSVEEVRHAKG